MVDIKKIFVHRNFPWRVSLIVLAVIPLLFIRDFYIHFHAHFTGTLLPNVVKGEWHIVILNILIFIGFFIPLWFRRKINWKEFGVVAAFFVSLFVEMYGIPLTVFFASEYMAGSSTQLPNTVFDFTIFGVHIGMSHAMIYGTLLMLIGMALIVLGWITLYKNIEDEEIVTKGVYSYSRHPQYLGFILIVIGWLVGWPTILTVIFAPILIFMYIRVSRIEEKELSGNEDYRMYLEEVPFLI